MQIFLSLLSFLLLTCAVGAGEASRQEYLELIKLYPHLVSSGGDSSKGEIEIILDPQEMAAIEKAAGRDVGIIAQDKYLLWINDACLFPSGHKGVYARILPVKSLGGPAGVAVMPVLPDGKIVLNCNFRHATRSWEIELPRGGVNFGEKVEAAAKRETIEETGMLVDHLSLLGEMPPDTGLTNTVAPIFLAKVMEKQNPEQEESEAIEEILSLTVQEIKQAFLRGYLEWNVRGIQKQIPFRDPFLAYAILLYELKQANPMSTNDITLNSYELSVNEYIAGTTAEVSGSVKTWIDTTIALLPPSAHILEIGSAFGRDARYIESQGFSVERTDATEGFVTLLQQNGYPAHKFNVLTDEFTATYDLIFANAVFLHFTPPELQKILAKVNTSLNDKGILAFSVKRGEGEEWTTAKVGHPRYFCYWSADKIKSLLETTSFTVLSIAEDEKFLQIIATKNTQ